MTESKWTLCGQVYVALLDEGIEVYRPVDAVWLQEDLYQLVAENQHREDERWQFSTGEIVRCRQYVFRAFGKNEPMAWGLLLCSPESPPRNRRPSHESAG
jgi:hypothetical protein